MTRLKNTICTNCTSPFQPMMSNKMLYEQIHNLGETEHSEIFKILQKGHVPYTENQNGVFFDLKTIDANVVQDIINFVVYCTENKVKLDEYDQKINECKYRNNIGWIHDGYMMSSGVV